jgi:hypothetical protein
MRVLISEERIARESKELGVTAFTHEPLADHFVIEGNRVRDGTRSADRAREACDGPCSSRLRDDADSGLVGLDPDRSIVLPTRRWADDAFLQHPLEQLDCPILGDTQVLLEHDDGGLTRGTYHLDSLIVELVLLRTHPVTAFCSQQ